MKLRGSDNRGGITVKHIQRALAHNYILYNYRLSVKLKDCHKDDTHSNKTIVTWKGIEGTINQYIRFIKIIFILIIVMCIK